MQTLELAMFAIWNVEWFDFTSKSYMSIAVWNASEIESQMSCWNWFTSYRQHVSNWLPNNLFMNHSTNEYLFIKVFILEGIVGSVKRYNLENWLRRYNIKIVVDRNEFDLSPTLIT